MQRACNQFLTCTRFARDQRGHARARQPADRFENLLHRRRLTDQQRFFLTRRKLRHRFSLLSSGTFDELDGIVDVEWFRQILECTALIGGNGAVEVRVCRDDDHRQLGLYFMNALHQLESAHAGHTHVCYDDIGRVRCERIEKVACGPVAADADICLGQRLFEHPAYRFVVIDDPGEQPDVVHASAPPSTCEASYGMRRQNRVWPGSLSTSIRP